MLSCGKEINIFQEEIFKLRTLIFLWVLTCGLVFAPSTALSQQRDFLNLSDEHGARHITKSGFVGLKIDVHANGGMVNGQFQTNGSTALFSKSKVSKGTGGASPLSWTRTYDNREGLEDYGFEATSDSQKNVIVAGWTESEVAGCDFCIVKYDNNGNFLWTQSWGGTGLSDDFAYSVRCDTQDNIILCGPAVSAGDNWDIGVVKFDPHGNLQWANVYDGPANGNDLPSDQSCLAIDPFDNVVVVGSSAGVSTGYDLLTVKYASDGTMLWEQRYHNPSGTSDIGYAIAVDDLGEIYAAGTTNQGNQDFVALKYDVNGQLIWSFTFDGGASNDERLYDMEVDNSYNVILVGISKPSAIEGDFLIVKLDPFGALDWVSYYSSPNGYDLPFGVAVDDQGTIGITGVSQKPFSGSMATVCYDKDGKLLWAEHQVGSNYWAGDNASFDIEFDDSGFAYVAGYLYMGVPDGFDGACFKYAPNGDLVRQWQFNGASGGNDQLYGMHVDGTTVVAVGGTTNAVGSPDMLTMKLDTLEYTK